jgi:H+/Cl- antiporter ClcA
MPLVWLIALVVCCAAAVGGATSELRSGRSVTHDSTLAMLAAFFGGIVVLLCLKGGTGVLFDHNDALDVRVNHYGAALAGVLAGLFSRRFYHLLEHTVDEAMTRLTRPNDTPPKCTRVCPMAAGASTDTQQPAEISDQQKASKAP